MTHYLHRAGGGPLDGATATGLAAIEREIASVWCEVLGLDRVGTSDNFFEVGGTSKLAVVIQERLGKRAGRKPELVEFFQYPTVGSLAAFLDGTADPAALRRAARRGEARHVTGRRHASGKGRTITTATPGEDQ